MPKLSGSLAAGGVRRASATRASSIAACDERRIASGRTVSSSDCRAPKSRWKAPSGHDDPLVLRLAEHRPLLRGDADDAEVDAVDREHLVDRIEQRRRAGPPTSHPTIATSRPSSNSLGVMARPRSMVVDGRSLVFLGHAADADGVERLAAVLHLAPTLLASAMTRPTLLLNAANRRRVVERDARIALRRAAARRRSA